MVAVARMALLLPGLSCRLIDSPLTSWTPNSVMVTFSSTTVIVFSAKIESDKGDNTCGTARRRKSKDETGWLFFSFFYAQYPLQTNVVVRQQLGTCWLEQLCLRFHDSDATLYRSVNGNFFISCWSHPRRNQQWQLQPRAKL